MVAEVNKLINNTLCQGRDLFLPEVGTLIVRRNAASRASSTKMAPPCRTVTFTGEQRGENIVSTIVSTAGVDNARAEEIYAEWLQSAKQENKIVINGVGAIVDKKFVAEKSFSAALNPAGNAVVELKPRSNWKSVVAVIAAVAIVAVVAVLVINRKPAPEPIPAPVVEQVVPAPEPEPVVVKDPDVEDMTAGASYVVWGVFAEKANALKYKQMITRKYGDIVTPTIYHHKDNTMYLLALAEKSTRNKCIVVVEQLQEIDGLFDELWIFTNK